MSFDELLKNPTAQNVVATGLTFGLVLLWLRAMDTFAEREVISQQLSRKLIHIGTGPFFLLCWNCYSSEPSARWLAALVPGAITLQFIAIGLGWIKDPAAVKAMSRTGDPREILQGPVYYGVIFVIATLAFWRSSPVGIVALMILCGGDGLADIVGRRWGRRTLPWSPGKSWAGSAGMLVGSLTFAGTMLAAFNAFGDFGPGLDGVETVRAVLLISVVAAAVESLPIPRVDNLTVFASGVLTAWLLIHPTGLWQVQFWVSR